jgi:2-amino-4-hydroxy-6-hydroxymethyldihydropteridine diphosphokinase
MSAFSQDRAASAIVALGANLPHEGLAGAALLAEAVRAIEETGIAVKRRSGAWESPAWPPSNQPNYVNAVIEIDPGRRTAAELLALLMNIERAFGRERGERNAARTLDLDIIDFGGMVLEEEGLALPHPRAHERPFVLAPLAEMSPEWRHPVLNKTAAQLLDDLPDRVSVCRLGPLAT